MRTVWKYELPVADHVAVAMPRWAVILPFVHAPSPDTIQLWAEVDTEQAETSRVIVIVGTGNPIDPELYRQLSYLSSVVAGPFVWHVYELDSEVEE